MQSEGLDTEEIVAASKARGDVEVNPTLVLDHVVYTPYPAAGVEGVLPDLEPIMAMSVAGTTVF